MGVTPPLPSSGWSHLGVVFEACGCGPCSMLSVCGKLSLATQLALLPSAAISVSRAPAPPHLPVPPLHLHGIVTGSSFVLLNLNPTLTADPQSDKLICAPHRRRVPGSVLSWFEFVLPPCFPPSPGPCASCGHGLRLGGTLSASPWEDAPARKGPQSPFLGPGMDGRLGCTGRHIAWLLLCPPVGQRQSDEPGVPGTHGAWSCWGEAERCWVPPCITFSFVGDPA